VRCRVARHTACTHFFGAEAPLLLPMLNLLLGVKDAVPPCCVALPADSPAGPDLPPSSLAARLLMLLSVLSAGATPACQPRHGRHAGGQQGRPGQPTRSGLGTRAGAGCAGAAVLVLQLAVVHGRRPTPQMMQVLLSWGSFCMRSSTGGAIVHRDVGSGWQQRGGSLLESGSRGAGPPLLV
jgi:hypothetical protein